jgi:hypothetical protein
LFLLDGLDETKDPPSARIAEAVAEFAKYAGPLPASCSPPSYAWNQQTSRTTLSPMCCAGKLSARLLAAFPASYRLADFDAQTENSSSGGGITLDNANGFQG